MEVKDYLSYLVNVIHTTVVATVDDEGKPVTAAIDMMDYDDDSLYFLTAKGKSFYDRLVKRGCLALTGMKGEDTMSTVAISIKGEVRELGSGPMKDLFDKNTYMYDIYPTPESRKMISVFQIYKGSGEWFDLSRLPIERADFSFGGDREDREEYTVNDNCIACGTCVEQCPAACMKVIAGKAAIEEKNCMRCGNCKEVCPAGAVELSK